MHQVCFRIVIVAAVVISSAAFLVERADAQTFTPQQIERVVAMYFKDAPEMIEVARCESGMRQYTDSGATLRGGTGGMMIGLFQLHEGYHRAPAARMGINIDSLVGNLMYARHLYREEGITPWVSCAPSSVVQKSVTEDTADEREEKVSSGVITLTTNPQDIKNTDGITKRLTYGSRDSEVRAVQDVLKREGFLSDTYTSGQFDIPTMRALVRFQCEKGITCDAGTTLAEYGATGERTRAALQQ